MSSLTRSLGLGIQQRETSLEAEPWIPDEESSSYVDEESSSLFDEESSSLFDEESSSLFDEESSSVYTPSSYEETRNAGAGNNVAGIGTRPWVDAGNVTADDNNYATVTTTVLAISNYLQATNYGFNIPSDAIIDGIEVIISRYVNSAEGGTRARDFRVRLIKGGYVGNTAKEDNTVNWPTSETSRTYGSNSDKWGTTWTPAQINASDFGVALGATIGADKTAYVDYITVTVYYTY